MSVIRLAELADSRLDDYRNLRNLRNLHDLREPPDRKLRADGGKFIAESELVVRKLLASGWVVQSLLVTETRLRSLQDVLRPEIDTFVVAQDLLSQIAGFPVHRGCLAVGLRPTQTQVPPNARAVVALEDLVDVENLGGIVRNAAAFGVDALVLSPRCADPFYRKAIRVSIGNVFSLPIVRLIDEMTWPQSLRALCDGLSLRLVGAVVDARAQPLKSFVPPRRFALLLGSEGPGMTEAARDLCDDLVTIPMHRADSLNVATAGAVFLHHLLGEGTIPPPSD